MAKDIKYPANFIAEWLDQTRWWFYSLHVIGNIIKWQKAFENVVVNWLILAEDWKKMSKRLKNYPDPKYLLDKYWPDAFRLYILSSPVVKAEPLRFKESGVEEILKDVIIPLDNVYKFLETYAKVDKWKHPGTQVWYIRHWKANSNAEDEPLLPEAEKQMLEKDFIENIIRINPDIIYTSDILRAKQTANIIKFIVEKYLNKNIEVVIKPTFWESYQDKIVDTYKEMLTESNGKRIILVAHKLTFRPIWNYYYGEYRDNIDNLEIVKLPIFPIKNELDKWILSEYYDLLEKITQNLDKFYLDVATKNLIWFVDKLTNWYVRRSRRRFWQSGMSDDKISAYFVLTEVLYWYLKLLSPFAPFISEYIFLKLKSNIFANNLLESIHMEGWEIFSDKYVNKQLMKEIDIVRKIIKLWLYIRSKNKIKVKQPLRTLKVKI